MKNNKPIYIILYCMISFWSLEVKSQIIDTEFIEKIDSLTDINIASKIFSLNTYKLYETKSIDKTVKMFAYSIIDSNCKKPKEIKVTTFDSLISNYKVLWNYNQEDIYRIRLLINKKINGTNEIENNSFYSKYIFENNMYKVIFVANKNYNYMELEIFNKSANTKKDVFENTVYKKLNSKRYLENNYTVKSTMRIVLSFNLINSYFKNNTTRELFEDSLGAYRIQSLRSNDKITRIIYNVLDNPDFEVVFDEDDKILSFTVTNWYQEITDTQLMSYGYILSKKDNIPFEENHNQTKIFYNEKNKIYFKIDGNYKSWYKY